MIKRLALFAVLLTALVAAPASALDWEAMQWYGQGILSLPMGNFGDVANFGFGGGVGVHVPHDASWSFRGEASYIYYSTEDIPQADVSASIIPISVLAQYSLPDSKVYLLGGLGLAFAKASVDFETDIPGFSGSTSDTSTEFGITLGAGFEITPKVDLGARFNLISDANTLSGHVLYKF